MEEVNSSDEIQHEIIKETFKVFGIKDNAELTSHAEIPSGTGLGSSGTFGVGIIQAIAPYLPKRDLAQIATDVQLRLGFPIGLQDQYVAAYGGTNIYEVNKKGEVNVSEIDIKGLEDNLCLFFTGFKHDSNEVLRKSTTKGLKTIQNLAYESLVAFENKEYGKYGEILNEHWKFKKQRGGMTNEKIDVWYNLGIENGAVGGKLIGAGGGGFLMFYTEDRDGLIKAMPLQHIPFKFEYGGSKILVND